VLSSLLLATLAVMRFSTVLFCCLYPRPLQKVESIDKITGEASAEIKQKTLDYRRCIILAIVGATPTENPSLELVLSDGYLAAVKLWLDNVLSTPEGMFVYSLLSLASFS